MLLGCADIRGDLIDTRFHPSPYIHQILGISDHRNLGKKDLVVSNLDGGVPLVVRREWDYGIRVPINLYLWHRIDVVHPCSMSTISYMITHSGVEYALAD
jgi:hypothetical protein